MQFITQIDIACFTNDLYHIQEKMETVDEVVEGHLLI